MGQLVSLLITRWDAYHVCIYMAYRDVHTSYALENVLPQATAQSGYSVAMESCASHWRPHGQFFVDCSALCAYNVRSGLGSLTIHAAQGSAH